MSSLFRTILITCSISLIIRQIIHMATLREIKRRISSVHNIAQVTNAMQLVAASRMKRAQENAAKGKLYAQRIREIMLRLSLNKTLTSNPLLDTSYSDSRTVLVLVFSPERGLAGPLPSNLTKFTLEFVRNLRSDGYDVHVVSIGNKVRDQLARTDITIIADFSDMPEVPTTADIRPLLKLITDSYLEKQVSKIFMVFPDFVNPMLQTPRVETLIPLNMETLALAEESFDASLADESYSDYFIFEPNEATILSELIPQYMETQIFQKRLETIASEYSARMVAMKSATDNATDIKSDLTVEYNKSRQSQITTELSEISAARI